MKIEKAIEKYEGYLKTDRNFSPGTIRTYKEKLKEFIGFINGENITDITRDKVIDFLKHCIEDKDNSPVTRNNKLFAIKSFISYLLEEEKIDYNPVKNIHSLKTADKAEPIYIKRKHLNSYLQAIEDYETIVKDRNRALIYTIIYTGLRLAEVLSLERSSIDLEENTIKVIGKGNKERKLPIHKKLKPILSDYISELDTIYTKIFNMTSRNAQKIVKKYAKKADLPYADDISPHKLRHTFASLIYKKTKDLKMVQDLLGHESINTTQIYTHVDMEDKEKAVDVL